MLKSFTPVVMMITSYTTNIEIPTNSIFVSVFIVTIGTLTNCTYNPSFSYYGLVIMLLSIVTEAIR